MGSIGASCIVADLLLQQTDWSSLREAGGPASHVPTAVGELVNADSEEAADSAYRLLDNHVVVQGQLFQAALPLVPVLLSVLGADAPPYVHGRVMDLLFEIAAGGPDQSEIELGNTDLGLDCRAAVIEGRYLFYALLQNDEPYLRKTAVDLLGEVEPDRVLLLKILRLVAESDPDESVRESANWWTIDSYKIT